MTLRPTDAEAKWIRNFKALAKRRPKSIWLFSASGTLCVMRAAKDGSRHHLPPPETGFDPAYILDTVKIPNDGGDW